MTPVPSEYRLLYTEQAARDIRAIGDLDRLRIKKALERMRLKPLYYAKKMINSALGDYRFRVGNYRIVFDVDQDAIVILRVGHRREIYRQK